MLRRNFLFYNALLNKVLIGRITESDDSSGETVGVILSL